MDEMTYTEAVSELTNILNELESDRLDVDQVVVKAERAQELITLCRTKVENAKLAVEKLNGRGV